MKIFFDTEFTGLYKSTTLISIGLVSESGQQFYAEFTDYDTSAENNNWLKKNVFDHLITYHSKKFHEHPYIESLHVGDKDAISKTLENWLKQWDYVELVSDCCHFDMVLFCDIFGGAFYLPKNVCPTCYDINQDIAKFYGVNQQKAFDMNREQILTDNGIEIKRYEQFGKHNSLYDAYVIRDIYNIIQDRLCKNEQGEDNG